MRDKRNWLWLAVMAVLLGWTGYTVLKEQSLEQLIGALASANGWWLLAGFGLMAGFIGFEAWATHLILRALGSARPYGQCYAYSCAGFFFSNVTPSATGGQPAQVYYMSRDGIPVAHGTIDMLLVTIGYHTAVILFGAAALLAGRRLLPALGDGVGVLLGLGFIIFLILGAGMLLLLFLPSPMERLCRGGIRFALRLWPSLDNEMLRGRLEEELERYEQGARLIRSAPGLLPRVMAFCVGQQACSYAVPYLVCLAFGLTEVSFWDVFALQTLCTIAVGYLPLPGSAGAAENVFLRVFAFFFGAGMVAPAMILSRAVSCYAVMVVTGLVTGLLHIYRRPTCITPALKSRDERNTA